MAEHNGNINIRHYSRKPKPVNTLASQLRVLRQFANLRDDEVKWFRQAHPDFSITSALTEEGWIEGVVHRLGGSGPTLVSGRALVLAEAIRKLQPNPELRKRDILRQIWNGDEAANDYLKILLTGSRVEFDWKRGEIVYEPQNEFELAVYALFRNSSRARICGNSECLARYFIASRKSQVYCSERCAGVYQKEWKRNWWKHKGSSRRRQQRAKKRKTRS
jgi:hypothetical protein